jgi:hypothetical protein
LKKLYLLSIFFTFSSSVHSESWIDISNVEERLNGSILRINENIERQSDSSMLVRYETGSKNFDLYIPHKIKVDCLKRSVNYMGSFNMRNVSETLKSKIHKDIMTVFKYVCTI